MSYQHLFVLLGIVLAAFGLKEGGWFLLAVWLGCDFIILGIAYARGAHRVYGKRADGTLPLWSWLLFLPLFAYTLVVWHLIRVFNRESPRNTVNNTLVVGRRLLAFEHEGEFDNFVDLTAEFTAPRFIRGSPCYRNFPILDGSAPAPEALGTVIASLRPGRTFIHCAQGHGRTGLFALALLLSSGVAENIEDGMRILLAARPGIRLSRVQQRCIRIYAQNLANLKPSTQDRLSRGP